MTHLLPARDWSRQEIDTDFLRLVELPPETSRVGSRWDHADGYVPPSPDKTPWAFVFHPDTDTFRLIGCLQLLWLGLTKPAAFVSDWNRERASWEAQGAELRKMGIPAPMPGSVEEETNQAERILRGFEAITGVLRVAPQILVHEVEARRRQA
jgi:hypothetical protein